MIKTQPISILKLFLLYIRFLWPKHLWKGNLNKLVRGNWCKVFNWSMSQIIQSSFPIMLVIHNIFRLFNRFGVCCLFIVSSASSSISENCTYIQNPSFPSVYSSETALTYTINKVCFICSCSFLTVTPIPLVKWFQLTQLLR